MRFMTTKKDSATCAKRGGRSITYKSITTESADLGGVAEMMLGFMKFIRQDSRWFAGFVTVSA